MMNIKPIESDAFSRFGKVVRPPVAEPTAQDDTFKFWSDVSNFAISGETEIGFCTVYRQERETVEWMERHERTPELLVPIDVPFVLPVMTGEGDVEAFRVNPGEAVIIGQNIWHSACKPVGARSATYFVIFRRGTPAEDVIKTDIPPIEIVQHE